MNDTIVDYIRHRYNITRDSVTTRIATGDTIAATALITGITDILARVNWVRYAAVVKVVVTAGVVNTILRYGIVFHIDSFCKRGDQGSCKIFCHLIVL